MSGESPKRTWSAAERRALVAVVGIKLAAHLALIERYGIHRDELYFVACGRHLDWGYVDHAPLVPWLARAATELFGDRLWGLRLAAVLAGALTVALTMALTRELGGRVRAQLLAGVCVVAAPAYLRMAKMLCIPVFEPLLWTLGALLLLRLSRKPTARRWLLLGAVAGVGLLTKHSMVLWIVAAAVAIVATPLRAELRAIWPWLAALLGALIALPNLLWQVANGFPTLEFLQEMRAMLDAVVPWWLFLVAQSVFMHPLTTPVWIAGLAWLLSGRGARHRVLLWLYLVPLGLLLLLSGKPYYLAPAYPPLFATGAVALAPWMRRRLKQAPALLLVLGSPLCLALGLPVLPVPTVDRVVEVMFGGMVRPTDLTLELHDEHGWKGQVAVAARVYHRLDAAERDEAAVLVGNYGQAGAVDYFGPQHGLPPASSGHMSYYLWGPSSHAPRTIVAYGVSRRRLESLFSDVRGVALIDHPLGMPWERNLTVYVCRQPKRALGDAWPEFRRYHNRTVP